MPRALRPSHVDGEQRFLLPLFTRLELLYNHAANTIAGLVKEVENTRIQKEDKEPELRDTYNSQRNMGHDNPAEQSFIECIQVVLGYEDICSCRALDAGTLLHLK